MKLEKELVLLLECSSEISVKIVSAYFNVSLFETSVLELMTSLYVDITDAELLVVS